MVCGKAAGRRCASATATRSTSRRIKGWIVQSYRAVATKKLVKLLDAGQA